MQKYHHPLVAVGESVSLVTKTSKIFLSWQILSSMIVERKFVVINLIENLLAGPLKLWGAQA
jgi:hypothetical protein